MFRMKKPKTKRGSGEIDDEGPAVLLIVVGPLGSGKTEFVNKLLHRPSYKSSSESLSDVTQEIKVSNVPIDIVKGYPAVMGHRLLIADTPGLDGFKSLHTVNQIEDWLKKQSARIKLTSVAFIYLHDISEDRLSESTSVALKNFRFLLHSCGCKIGETVIGTTKWRRIEPAMGQDRVKQLTESVDYWKPLVTKGSLVRKFEDTHASALEFVDIALRKVIVIPVMGATGAGKSSFINKLFGKEVVEVGHGMKSCTEEVHTVFIDDLSAKGYKHLAHYRLVIVDTPGFDDTYKPEAIIFRQIADWLEQSYRRQETTMGVIYLHKISDNKFTGSAQRNLDIFRQICGDDALQKVVLATTMWSGDVIDPIFKNRETDLKQEFWRPLIDKGSKVKRLFNTTESAEKLVHCLLESFSAREIKHQIEIALQIQKELVDDRKPFSRTKAGEAVSENLKKNFEDLRKNYVSGPKENRAEAERYLDDLKKQLRITTQESKSLGIPIRPKWRSFLGL